MPVTDRRTFLASAAAATLAAATVGAQDAPPQANRFTLALIGAGGRGGQLASSFATLPGVWIKYICDPDLNHAQGVAKMVATKAEANNHTPASQCHADFRQTLTDKDLNGVIVATPDHWHAPAAILAAAAGKHVYVEKPC